MQFSEKKDSKLYYGISEKQQQINKTLYKWWIVFRGYRKRIFPTIHHNIKLIKIGNKKKINIYLKLNQYKLYSFFLIVKYAWQLRTNTRNNEANVIRQKSNTSKYGFVKTWQKKSVVKNYLFLKYLEQIWTNYNIWRINFCRITFLTNCVWLIYYCHNLSNMIIFISSH